MEFSSHGYTLVCHYLLVLDGGSTFLNVSLIFSYDSPSVRGAPLLPRVSIIFLLGLLPSVHLRHFLRALICVHHMPIT